jgi:hypothetical protein
VNPFADISAAFGCGCANVGAYGEYLGRRDETRCTPDILLHATATTHLVSSCAILHNDFCSITSPKKGISCLRSESKRIISIMAQAGAGGSYNNPLKKFKYVLAAPGFVVMTSNITQARFPWRTKRYASQISHAEQVPNNGLTQLGKRL